MVACQWKQLCVVAVMVSDLRNLGARAWHCLVNWGRVSVVGTRTLAAKPCAPACPERLGRCRWISIVEASSISSAGRVSRVGNWPPSSFSGPAPGHGSGWQAHVSCRTSPCRAWSRMWACTMPPSSAAWENEAAGNAQVRCWRRHNGVG